MKKLRAINKRQEAAYERVAKAIESANKAGLVFFGKSEKLVAYTKQSDEYVEHYGFENLLGLGSDQIENLSQPLLRDSGADDFPCYAQPQDNPWHDN